MRKVTMLLLVALVFTSGAAMAQEQCTYTHGELVDYLLKLKKLDPPLPQSAQVDLDEAYRIKIRALLSKGGPPEGGIQGFQRISPVDRGLFVSTVFWAAGNITCDGTGVDSRASCLVVKGYLPPEIEQRLCGKCQLTHGELVDLLIKALNYEREIPPSLIGKPIEEIYRFKVKLLLSKGHPKILDGYTYSFIINRGYFADVAYEIIGERLGCGAMNSEERLTCLVNNKLVVRNIADEAICSDELVELFAGEPYTPPSINPPPFPVVNPLIFKEKPVSPVLP